MAKKQDPAKPAEEKAAAPAAEAPVKKEKKPREPKAKEPKAKAKTAPEAPAAAPEAAAPAGGDGKAAPAAPVAGEATKKRGAPGMPPRRGKKLRNQLKAYQQKIVKSGPTPLKQAVGLLKQMKRAK